MTPRAYSEATLQREIVLCLRKAGYLVTHVPIGDAWSRRRIRQSYMGTQPGWPDLVVCGSEGEVVFVEVKLPGGKLSPAQGVIHSRLRAMGHDVVVAKSVSDVVEHFCLIG